MRWNLGEATFTAECAEEDDDDEEEDEDVEEVEECGERRRGEASEWTRGECELLDSMPPPRCDGGNRRGLVLGELPGMARDGAVMWREVELEEGLTEPALWLLDLSFGLGFEVGVVVVGSDEDKSAVKILVRVAPLLVVDVPEVEVAVVAELSPLGVEDPPRPPSRSDFERGWRAEFEPPILMRFLPGTAPPGCSVPWGPDA